MALKSFLIIEQAILQDNRLTISEKLVFAYCWSYWRSSGVCISSNNQIAKYLGLERRTVIKAINRLELLGCIKIRYEKSTVAEISRNVIRVIEKPIIPEAEQLTLLFKSAIYGKNKK